MCIVEAKIRSIVLGSKGGCNFSGNDDIDTWTNGIKGTQADSIANPGFCTVMVCNIDIDLIELITGNSKILPKYEIK